MNKPLPLWIVTGFLGSGKTTFIRSLIQRPEFGRLAIVINEFGEVGLDHDIIEASSDDVYELVGGCLCCMVRGDLSETLTDLVTRRTVGELAQFDGVLIETSGLADPGPVIDMVLNTSPLKAFYQLKAVVTVIDAINAGREMIEEAVAAAQTKAADILVVTKADLSTPSAIDTLSASLREIAPHTRLRILDRDRVDEDLIQALLDGQARDPARSGNSIRAPEHDFSGIQAYVVNLRTPLDQKGLDACIAVLHSLAGAKLMRAKALVVLPDPRKPVVLQAVREMVYPPMPLAGPPHGHTTSRMVLITRDVDRSVIDDLLAAHQLVADRAPE
jgi:G3E family GTPase